MAKEVSFSNSMNDGYFEEVKMKNGKNHGKKHIIQIMMIELKNVIKNVKN